MNTYKSVEEIRKAYLDHIESVRLSGLGSEGYRAEILSAMAEEIRAFENSQ